MRGASAQPFSAGIAEAGDAQHAPELLTAADRACYLAKQDGRGQIKVAISA
jgi:GGDEF domain-containing protein